MENNQQNPETSTTPQIVDDNDIYIIEEDHQVGGPMKFFQRLFSIFFSPVKLMENLAAFPKAGAASLYILLLSAAIIPVTFLSATIVIEDQAIVIAERYGVEFMNLMLNTQVGQDSMVTYVIGWVSTVLTMFFMAVFSTLILIIITKLARGTARFNQYFALFLHVSVVAIVGSGVISALMLVTGSSMTFTSLAPYLMPTGNFTMVDFNFYSSIELFSIWVTVLTIIGIKKINEGFSTARAVTVGGIYYAISVGLTTAMTSSAVFIYDMSYNAMQGM